jgi:hypothetical protein
MGALKGRFGSLRGLRQRLDSRKAQILANEWVRTCIVLHNLILEVETTQDDMWELELQGDNADAHEVEGFEWNRVARNDVNEISAEEKRSQVQEALFAQLY